VLVGLHDTSLSDHRTIHGGGESWGSFISKALGFSVPNAALLGLQLFQFRLTPPQIQKGASISGSQAPVNKSEKEHKHSNGLTFSSQRKKKRKIQMPLCQNYIPNLIPDLPNTALLLLICSFADASFG
jgi:hypothetical protein